MLLRYVVSNYKSIGHPVEFSMFPTENNIDDRFLKTIHTKSGDWRILQRGAFFGPNAAGKSSFIESIRFIRNYVINFQRSGKGTGVNQFKGNFEDLRGQSIFQFMFYLDEDVYEYGVSMDRHQIHEEWLMKLSKNDFVPMFTRVTDDSGKTSIEITAALARRNSKNRKIAEILVDSIREEQKNQLFLYKLSENGVEKAEKIVGWFRDLQLVFPSTKVQALPIRMRRDKNLQQYIAEMLEKMDTGVFDISVASNEIDFHEYAEKLDLPKEIIEDIEEVKTGIVNLGGRYFIFSENKNKRTMMIQLKFNHRLNNHVVGFNMEDESDGTQRLLDLLPMLFTVGKNSNIYFIDEIDRSLHTKISQFLLDEFASKAAESTNQLIFTAHDVNLLNLMNFRQEEIWFIEKNGMGETILRPFSDFELKEGQDALKAYLGGRFGAVPMIKGVF